MALTFPCYGQHPVIHNLSDLDGLPSPTLYDLLQDDSGALWIGTDNGISRFDGVNFRNFGYEDGLNDVSIIHLYRDYLDRIWGMGYNGTLSCIDGEKIVPVNNYNKIIGENLNQYIDRMHIDSLGRMWLATRSGGVYFIDKDGKLNTRYDSDFDKENKCLFFKDFGNFVFVSLVEDSYGLSADNKLLKIDDEYFLWMDEEKMALHRNVIKIGAEEFLVSYRRKLSHIKNGKQINITEFEKRIIDISRCDNEEVIVTVNSGGAFVYNLDKQEVNRLGLLEDLTISRSFRDKEGTCWFSSLRDGLYYVNSFDFSLIENSENETDYKVLSITGGDNSLFFLTYGQSIYSLNTGQKELIARQFNVEIVSDFLSDLHYQDNGLLWITGTNYPAYFPDATPAVVRDLPTGLIISELKNGTLLFSGPNEINMVFPDLSFKNGEGWFEHRIFSVFEDSEGNILVGTMNGLYIYAEGRYTRPAQFPPITNTRITSIVEMDNYRVVGTAGDGIFLFNEDTLFSLEENLPIGSVRINCLLNEGDTVLWAGTNNGLIKYTREHPSGNEFNHIRYARCDGLPSNRVNDLFLMDDILWVGTDFGLVLFENRFEDKILLPPSIKLNAIIVNNVEVPVQDSVYLESDENNLRFMFEGISLKGPENINFRFMLSGHDDQILYTKNNFVNYSNLRPGKYLFHVNAGNNNGDWNNSPHTTYLFIAKPFQATTWFYIILIGGGIILITFAVLMVFRQQRRRNKLREELLEMQQRLLRTQMNPHFIFNSLLSIQNFIYKNEPGQAGKYLSRFAKLIRLILRSSRKEVITLEEEIEFLNYYLALQKLRFKKRFDYQFDIDEKIRQEQVYIPPMLAQPFIENAIEHGLKDISHEGIIQIRFFMENSYLVFEVEDNGVGIYRSEREKSLTEGNHESLGQQITYDRLRLLNKKNKKVSYSADEIRDEKGNVKGTKIQFRINIE